MILAVRGMAEQDRRNESKHESVPISRYICTRKLNPAVM